eukprot:TRINITY_DN6487_c0_g1_i4.p1 TRINITY_DN6487_c0_g1~~TRINITY_DN6487_c0_g1_i4.p1  ORF type:complete len:395 (-),score=92.95 TRINITY_DN6487_c0_g1_i4:309-1493(-)
MSRLLLVFMVMAAMAAGSELSPEQVHTALGAADGSMSITFLTVGSNETAGVSSWVELGATKVPATISTYTAGGWVGLVHKAMLTGLVGGQGYKYRCGTKAHGSEQSSDWFDMKFLPKDLETVKLAIVADLDGREAAGVSTIDAMSKEVEAGKIDALLHAGDIAYIKSASTEQIYDTFLNQMQPIASRVPYHVAVGNQEHWNNFSGYDNRFAMPGSNFWHSISVGPVHAVFLSTEHEHGPGSPQYAWAEDDLRKVDRSLTPWVMVLLHRPLYCSTNDYYDCRIAGPKELRPAVEPLLLQYGVDVVVAGHVHNYERTSGMVNGSQATKGPVHITVGNAGDIEGMTHGWMKPRPEWSLVQSTELGWSRWTATPKSLLLELIASANGTILDNVTFVKK